MLLCVFVPVCAVVRVCVWFVDCCAGMVLALLRVLVVVVGCALLVVYVVGGVYVACWCVCVFDCVLVVEL